MQMKIMRTGWLAALALVVLCGYASADSGDAIKLDGVVYEDAKPQDSVAILNGELLKQGDIFQDAVLEEIGQDYVILKPQDGGQKIRVALWSASGKPAAPATSARTAAAPADRDEPSPFPAQIPRVASAARTGDPVGRIVHNGAPVYLGDVIRTDAQSSLSISLADETLFTIGPNSAIVIDEFVYDPATQDGTLTAHIVEGVFRFITGKIAHKQPEHMQVNLPAGFIGVRGTWVEGRVEPDGSALVVLRGAGPLEAADHPAAILVSGAEGGSGVLISQAGYGTRIARGRPPAPAFVVPQADLDVLQQLLQQPPPAAEASTEPLPPRPTEGLTESQQMNEKFTAVAKQSGIALPGGLDPFGVLNYANEIRAMADLRQLYTACAVSINEEQTDAQGNMVFPTLTIAMLKQRELLPQAFAEKTAYYTYMIQQSGMDFEIHAVPFNANAGLRYLMVDRDGIMHASHGSPATMESPQP